MKESFIMIYELFENVENEIIEENSIIKIDNKFNNDSINDNDNFSDLSFAIES